MDKKDHPCIFPMFVLRRNTQIRMLRDIFLNNAHPECQLVCNCLQKDKYNGDMKLSENLDNDFDTVVDLQEALTSNTMYLHPQLYDRFCQGKKHFPFSPMHF